MKVRGLFRQSNAKVAEAQKDLQKYSVIATTALTAVAAASVNMANKFNEGFGKVAGEMRKLDDLTRVITESMNEMASGAVQINDAVQDVNQITQKNKEAIESLVTEVEKFKV